MAAKRETSPKTTPRKATKTRTAAKAPSTRASAGKSAAPKKTAAKPKKAAASRRTPAKPRPAAAKARPATRKPATPRKKAALPPVSSPLAPGLSEEERIEAAKYLPRDLPKRLFEEEQFLFPESYGITRVRLLIKDPEWLFVHWDVDPATMQALRAELGERVLALTRLTLRVADADNGGSQTILLPPGSRSWYVRADAGHPRAYKAELGLTLPSGDFRFLAESNTVATPRVGPAGEGAAPRKRLFGTTPGVPERGVRGPAAAKAPGSTPEAALEPWKPEPEHTDAADPAAKAAPAEAAPRSAAARAKGGASDAFAPPGASETHRR